MVNSQTSYHRLAIHKILVLLLLICLSWSVGHGNMVTFLFSSQTDIQTSSQRFQLTASQPRNTLSPDQSLDEVLNYEVKELGTHM